MRSFLVVAHSARMLAQSAARGAHPVCTLDLFNDRDTRLYALASEAVDARPGESPGFDADDLLRRALRLCPPAQCQGLVYGAGFEDDTATLERLAQGRPLVGNRPELVRLLKDPEQFFGLLDRLSIAHPMTVTAAPAAPRGWLYKRRGATGGRHVVDAAAMRSEAVAGQGYFQRRCPGRSLSMLFLADGQRAVVVGISEQLTLRHGPCRFAYAGAIGPVPVPPSVAAQLRASAIALVGATGLIGCNSLDFMLDRGRPEVLEINPRPSATVDLYDADWPGGLFGAHLQACRGSIGEARRPRGGARATVHAHAIVHAGAALCAVPPMDFPGWCSDLPQTGTALGAGAPVCTVHAQGEDVEQARAQLWRRRRRVEFLIREQLNTEEIRDGSRTSQAERESAGRPAGRIAA